MHKPLALFFLTLVACADRPSVGSSPLAGDSVDPIAVAIAPSVVLENAAAELDGTASFDPDGAIKTFLWEQESGPAVALADADSARASFVAPSVRASTQVTFVLTVRDGAGHESDDSVVVRVVDRNRAPVAHVAERQDVQAKSEVTLDGSESSDADGSVASFSWDQARGPNVTVRTGQSSVASFTAPDVAQTTTLVFELSVIDDEGRSAKSTTLVVVHPVATGLRLVVPQLASFLRNQPWRGFGVEVINASGARVLDTTAAIALVTLRVAAEAGALHGALGRTTAEGVAFFSELYFDQVATVTVDAGADNLPLLPAASRQIVVTWPSTLPAALGGTQGDLVVRRVIASADGALLVVGHFRGDVAFALDGNAASSLSSMGQDGFIAKYTTEAALVFVRKLQSVGHDDVVDVALDGDAGGAVVAVSHTGPLTLTAAIGTVQTESFGVTDVSVVTVDGSGFATFKRTFGSAFGDERPTAVMVHEGKIYISGHYEETFDVGAQSVPHAVGDGVDGFMLALDPNAAEPVWSARLGGSGDQSILGFAALEGGKVALGGGFSETVDFDPDLVDTALETSTTDMSGYLWVLDEHGQHLWHRVLAGSVGASRVRALGLFGGDIIAAGEFQGVATLVADEDVSVDAGDGNGLFVVAYDTDGDRRFGQMLVGPLGARVHALSASSRLVVAVSADGPLAWEAVPEPITIQGSASGAALLSLDSYGRYVWHGAFGGVAKVSSVYPSWIADHLYVAASVGAGSLDVDPKATTVDLSFVRPGVSLVKLDASGQVVP